MPAHLDSAAGEKRVEKVCIQPLTLELCEEDSDAVFSELENIQPMRSNVKRVRTTCKIRRLFSAFISSLPLPSDRRAVNNTSSEIS